MAWASCSRGRLVSSDAKGWMLVESILDLSIQHTMGECSYIAECLVMTISYGSHLLFLVLKGKAKA